jgi:hypothetical protein
VLLLPLPPQKNNVLPPPLPPPPLQKLPPPPLLPRLLLPVLVLRRRPLPLRLRAACMAPLLHRLLLQPRRRRTARSLHPRVPPPH